ncbi:MAG: hypothetical protein ACTFAL_11480 [Candidatus Electronema sp. V4]|uniref:hypothetical protein n=1 Tax=Candidatus Electronema sp. V4 TaxID=3454756 RepID=UPI004055561C
MSALFLTGCSSNMRGDIGSFSAFLSVTFLIIAVIFGLIAVFADNDEKREMAGSAGLVASALFVLTFMVA